MGIPMVISILMVAGWLLRQDKRWSTQTSYLVGLLLVMAAGIPFAANTFSVVWTTYGMAVTILCICIPLSSIVTSVRRVRAWVNAFVAVSMYVGGWALLHGGLGPSGADGGQDENYVAAMMAMAIPFAYFSIFAERRWFAKLLLSASVVVFTGAIIVGLSRGGFLGLAAVVLYCLARSPRKVAGFTIVAVIGVAALFFAGPAYWEEMSTITDTSESTADLRIEVWKIGVRMWQANPILGIGAGNFRWHVGDYQSADQLDKYGRDLSGSIIAHSLPVELLAELGAAGVVVVGALLWGTWRNLRKVQRGVIASPGEPVVSNLIPLAHYADAVIASILACLVTGTFLSLLYFEYLWLLIAMGIAITQVFRAEMKAQDGRSDAGTPARTGAGGSAVRVRDARQSPKETSE
jgi:O-antigen ligase